MKKVSLFLALCPLALTLLSLQAYRTATASPYSKWTITIWQSGCNAETEGWLGLSGEPISDSWGQPEWLTCYSSSASQDINAYGYPDEAWYYIGFDWNRDGEFEEMLHDIVPVIDGRQFSKTYTHSPETVTIEGSLSSAVGGLVVPVNKFGLLAPYIGLTSTIIAATVATSIYVKRAKHRKEKQ